MDLGRHRWRWYHRPFVFDRAPTDAGTARAYPVRGHGSVLVVWPPSPGLAGEQPQDLAPVHQPAEAAGLVDDDEPLDLVLHHQADRVSQ